MMSRKEGGGGLPFLWHSPEGLYIRVMEGVGGLEKVQICMTSFKNSPLYHTMFCEQKSDEKNWVHLLGAFINDVTPKRYSFSS